MATRTFQDAFLEFIPLLAAVALSVATLVIADWLLLRRRSDLGTEARQPRQVIMLILTALALTLIILTIPISEGMRGNLLSLLGVVLTAIIALSSTTFVSNAMAGLMLRAVRSFRSGDFVRVGDHFGRVTERGLFHTEIQTEDRDLCTLPNMYLVQNPVTVVRASGTIVSCTLSLGYDVDHSEIEALLVVAASRAGLGEPFVQVMKLGDFTVTYRVAGFLEEVRQLISARSKLRKSVLDTLHGAGIEIMSPTFMTQRHITPEDTVIPETPPATPPVAEAPAGAEPEKMIFDKAEAAEQLEKLREERDRLRQEIKTLAGELARAADNERARIEARVETNRKRIEQITEQLDAPPEGDG